MPHKLNRLLTGALLLGAAGAMAGPGPIRPVGDGGIVAPLMIPVAEMEKVDCAKLDVTVEVGSSFDEMECSLRASGGYGGESVQIDQAKIVLNTVRSNMVVFHDHGGVRTYMQQQSPRSLFEDGLDYDVPGSWQSADSSNDFEIATFFARFESGQFPCFAFTRYAGHVAHTTGYQNRVLGVYCQRTAGTQPLSAARIDEVTARIKASFF